MKYLAGVSSLEYSADKCSGCGRCVEVCPRAVFVMLGKKAAVVDRDACMECGACQRNCAYGAIKVDAGVGCARAIINGMMT
ncbi:MAG: mercury methylation ferredoxin HgcB, partial [Deltaproteobacteria bacterium]|nr:mercury methylation ferredoxin HgcB [Deltaproteobacteria bacterium]